MFLKNSLIFIFIFILSCQPVEVLQIVDIDNSKFGKISVNAKNIELNIAHKSLFSEENIEGLIKNPPVKVISNWHIENINKLGNENKFTINILDASIFKKEIENINAKTFEEKKIFKYEVFFLVEYELYDNIDILLANVTVESSRTTTSPKYISINETEIIINDLLFNALKDFTIEAEFQLSTHMNEYIIN